MATLKFDVFGRRVQVARQDGRWTAFYAGDEGKRRIATDIVIPEDTPEEDLITYLADLCHEWASSRNPDVRKL
ncbi:MAG: hypothetical protein AAGA95_18840 [Pseudomonadota bacterium]